MHFDLCSIFSIFQVQEGGKEWIVDHFSNLSVSQEQAQPF